MRDTQVEGGGRVVILSKTASESTKEQRDGIYSAEP